MRKIVILTTLIISLTTISAQISDPFDYTEVFDHVFRNVSRTDATTGILYERVVPFAQLHKFNSNLSIIDTSSREHFMQAYKELYKASFQSVNSLPFDWETLQSFCERNSMVDIGILHYKYNTMDSAVVYQKLYFDSDSILWENTTITTSLYAEKTAFVASPFEEFVNMGTTAFRLRNLFRFDNTGNPIIGLWVDFDDGMGLQQIMDSLIAVTYISGGVKTLHFKALLNNGDTLMACAILNCLDPSNKGGGAPGSQSHHPYIETFDGNRAIEAKVLHPNPYGNGSFTHAKGTYVSITRMQIKNYANPY